MITTNRMQEFYEPIVSYAPPAKNPTLLNFLYLVVGISTFALAVLHFGFPPTSKNFEMQFRNPRALVASRHSKSCSVGYTLFKNSCYKAHYTPSTLANAQKVCANENASLTTMNSQKESDFVTGYYLKNMEKGAVGLEETKRIWVGAGEQEVERRGEKMVQIKIEKLTGNAERVPANEMDLADFICKKFTVSIL